MHDVAFRISVLLEHIADDGAGGLDVRDGEEAVVFMECQSYILRECKTCIRRWNLLGMTNGGRVNTVFILRIHDDEHTILGRGL